MPLLRAKTSHATEEHGWILGRLECRHRRVPVGDKAQEVGGDAASKGGFDHGLGVARHQIRHALGASYRPGGRAPRCSILAPDTFLRATISGIRCTRAGGQKNSEDCSSQQ